MLADRYWLTEGDGLGSWMWHGTQLLQLATRAELVTILWLGDNSFVHGEENKYRIGDLRDDDDWIHFPFGVDLMHNFGRFYGFLTSAGLA